VEVHSIRCSRSLGAPTYKWWSAFSAPMNQWPETRATESCIGTRRDLRSPRIRHGSGLHVLQSRPVVPPFTHKSSQRDVAIGFT